MACKHSFSEVAEMVSACDKCGLTQPEVEIRTLLDGLQNIVALAEDSTGGSCMSKLTSIHNRAVVLLEDHME
jgi:hypothetical protein